MHISIIGFQLAKCVPTCKIKYPLSLLKVDGEVLLQLTACDDYLKEIASLIGDRLKIKRVDNSNVSYFSVDKQLSSILIAPVEYFFR